MSNLEIAKQIVEKMLLTSGVFGLRKTYDLDVGDDVPNSFDWDYENDCSSDVELDGASVIGLPDVYDADDADEIEAIVEYMDQYPGNRLVLVSGDHAGFGIDRNEVLISNGTVVMAWDK